MIKDKLKYQGDLKGVRPLNVDFETQFPKESIISGLTPAMRLDRYGDEICMIERQS